jgi:hypothetical protein
VSNGKHPGVQIDVIRLGPGWAFVKAGEEHAPTLDELPLWLHQAITDWLTQNPAYRVRSTLPLVTGGQTFAIHVWFDGEGA